MRSRAVRRLASVAIAAIAIAIATGAVSSAWAQRAQPLRIVVPTAAGGASDVIARLMGQSLQEGLGVPVVIENKAGGLFAPALRDVANAPPDGNTILMVTTSVLMSTILHPEIPINLMRDFTPVIEVATGPLILVGRRDLGARTVAEVVAYARRNPGKLVFASPGGSGSAFALAAILLMSSTGIDAVNVPYKSASPALNDLLGGHVDVMFDAMPVEVGQVQAGNVTGLLVTGRRRAESLPDVPTAAEAGIADLDVAGWFGFLAPPRTPAPPIRRLRDAVAKALQRDDIVAQLDQQGVQAVGGTSDAWERLLKSELERWTQFTVTHGIKPD